MGSMGRKGSTTDATAILSTFPKFELVPIRRYFMTLPNALRPSRMPLWRTLRPGCNNTTSAAS